MLAKEIQKFALLSNVLGADVFFRLEDINIHKKFKIEQRLNIFQDDVQVNHWQRDQSCTVEPFDF